MAANTPINMIFAREQWIPIKENNSQLDPEVFSCQDDVVVSILKGHKLWKALSKNAEVPQVYLQQFWGTLDKDVDANGRQLDDVLAATICNTRVTITKELVQQVLQIPEEEHYDALASEAQIFEDMITLGHAEPLRLMSAIKTARFPRPWRTLMATLNKCCTSKHSGFDKCSGYLVYIFHGIAFMKNYDFTSLIWGDIL
ncbi:unnamed protein product, partial [Cuscuta epithymum]